MKKTTNYQFTLMEKTDPSDITQFNNNFEKIDTKMKSMENNSSTQNTEIKRDIADNARNIATNRSDIITLSREISDVGHNLNWKLQGSRANTDPIALPDSFYEILILIYIANGSNRVNTTINIPYNVLEDTGETYYSGAFLGGVNGVGTGALCSKTQVKLTDARINGTSKIDNAMIYVYYR